MRAWMHSKTSRRSKHHLLCKNTINKNMLYRFRLRITKGTRGINRHTSSQKISSSGEDVLDYAPEKVSLSSHNSGFLYQLPKLFVRKDWRTRKKRTLMFPRCVISRFNREFPVPLEVPHHKVTAIWYDIFFNVYNCQC